MDRQEVLALMRRLGKDLDGFYRLELDGASKPVILDMEDACYLIAKGPSITCGDGVWLVAV